MTLEEKIQISKEIQGHSVFFRGLWDISYIKFCDSLPTAAVLFDKEGSCLGMLINEKFWGELDMHEKCFVICHELCHFFLNHGQRFKDLNNKSQEEALRVNRGADVNINETLVRCWGFDRTKFKHEILQNLCWVDTVFVDDDGKQIKGIPVDESSDFYIKKLQELEKDSPKMFGSGVNFDDHKIIGDKSTDINSLPQDVKDQIKEFIENAAKEYAKNGKEHPFAREAGVGGGSLFDIGEIKRAQKRKWETVIKNWARKTLKEKDCDTDRWDFQNRRYSSVLSGARFMLPTEVNKNDEFEEKSKITLLFYLDTSGSCISYAKRFFEAAASLPKDRFDLKLFCFDTKVYEANLNDKVATGGGGTCEKAVERHVLSLKDQGIKPKSIWMLTDGYFMGKMNVESPKIWNFFLTESNSEKFLPSGSKKYRLSEYE